MTKMKENISKHKWAYLVVLAIAVVCAFVLGSSYGSLILCYIGIYCIATSGLDIVWGYTGQISYGHAGFYAIGAYVSALLSTKLFLAPLLTMVIGALAAALIGVIIALPAAKLVKHFLALLTLAFGQIVYQFVNNAKNITGGSAGIRDIPPVGFLGLRLDTSVKMFFLIIIVLIITLVVKNSIINSRTGRAFIAVRENTHAANGIGINPIKYKVMAFALSAFFTGLAGGLYTHLVCYISPDTFQPLQTITLMTMLLFGGIGNLYGALIGSTVIVLLKELLQVFSTYQQLIYAAVILIVLFLLPNGIVGVFNVVKTKIARKKAERSCANADS